MYRKMLVANDGSAGAAKALDTAIWLAKRFRAELHMISVAELAHLPATIDEVIEEKREVEGRLATVTATAQVRAKAGHVKLEVHVAAGHAVPRIVEFVETGGFDLLVVGFMGHSALYNRLIGSTTDRVVELAPCPVLVIK
jgi:nucleotide-binding universal stress UspA family protein